MTKLYIILNLRFGNSVTGSWIIIFVSPQNPWLACNHFWHPKFQVQHAIAQIQQLNIYYLQMPYVRWEEIGGLSMETILHRVLKNINKQHVRPNRGPDWNAKIVKGKLKLYDHDKDEKRQGKLKEKMHCSNISEPNQQ